MKKLVTLSAVISGLMAPVWASAANTAELKLIGTITPAACAPNFSAGAIDYGNIVSGTLNVTEGTTLPEKRTTLTVSCSAPTKFAVKFLDERQGTAVSGLINKATANQLFGLGATNGGVNIGAYTIKLANIASDSGSAKHLASYNNGTSWQPWNSESNITAGALSGFGIPDGEYVPVAHQSISTDVKISAAITKSSDLPITDEINLDGMTTVEVKYL